MGLFDDRRIGANLVLSCQRVDCEAEADVSVGDYASDEMTRYDALGMANAIEEEWPEGWGWDMSGMDKVLHCPKHRDGNERIKIPNPDAES